MTNERTLFRLRNISSGIRFSSVFVFLVGGSSSCGGGGGLGGIGIGWPIWGPNPGGPGGPGGSGGPGGPILIGGRIWGEPIPVEEKKNT